MIKLILYIVIIGALLYFGATVKLGKRTFFGHIHAIWATPEARDLKEGVKETAGPTVDRIEHGAKVGYKAMKDDGSAAGSAGSAAPISP